MHWVKVKIVTTGSIEPKNAFSSFMYIVKNNRKSTLTQNIYSFWKKKKFSNPQKIRNFLNHSKYFLKKKIGQV